MTEGASLRRSAGILAGAAGFAGLGYLAYAARAWHRYGSEGSDGEGPGGADLLDRFMPAYEVGERHAVEVAAPAEVTYAAARAMDINRAPLSRAIFAVRTLPSRLRRRPTKATSRGLVDETLELGWRILAEVPGRMLVVGAYTRPWEPEVRFHGLPAEEFPGFCEPGYAKIVWTLEAEPLGPDWSRFVTRTRVSTTDPSARARFRRYWAVVSPGILLIRRQSLALVKTEAERIAKVAGVAR